MGYLGVLAPPSHASPSYLYASTTVRGLGLLNVCPELNIKIFMARSAFLHRYSKRRQIGWRLDLHSLYVANCPLGRKSDKNFSQDSQLQIFAALRVLSFLTLSYEAWPLGKGIEVPHTPFSRDDAIDLD